MARVKIHVPCRRPLLECDCPPDEDDDQDPEPGGPQDGDEPDAA